MYTYLSSLLHLPPSLPRCPLLPLQFTTEHQAELPVLYGRFPLAIVALFMTSKTGKQPKCPSTNEWTKKMWHIFPVEHYPAIKRNETGAFAVIQVDLEDCQSEVSQKDKNILMHIGTLCSSDSKESACSAGDSPDSIPGSGRSSWKGNGSPLQYSCLENPIDSFPWGPKELDMTERVILLMPMCGIIIFKLTECISSLERQISL